MIIGFNNLLYLHVRGKITVFSHYITKLYRSAVVRYLHFPIITKWLLVLTKSFIDYFVSMYYQAARRESYHRFINRFNHITHG